MIEKAMEVAEKVPEGEEQMEEEEEEEEDEGENTENILPSSQRIEVINNSKAKKKQVKENDGDDPLFKLEGNIRMKKVAKLEQKKRKKNLRRADKLAAGLSDQMESAFSSIVEPEDYNVDN